MDRRVRPGELERTLPVDSAAALECTRVQMPDRRAERDALIAAAATVHGMAAVTATVADFDATGAEPLNPWSEP